MPFVACLGLGGPCRYQIFICGQPIALAANESPAGREARVKKWHVIEFFFLSRMVLYSKSLELALIYLKW